MIVTSFQDIKFRLKQISHCFPYMCGSNCVLKWHKSALFMGVVERKTRKEVFLSIRYQTKKRKKVDCLSECQAAELDSIQTYGDLFCSLHVSRLQPFV